MIRRHVHLVRQQQNQTSVRQDAMKARVVLPSGHLAHLIVYLLMGGHSKMQCRPEGQGVCCRPRRTVLHMASASAPLARQPRVPESAR